MVRKLFLLSILFLFVFLGSGCTIAKSVGGACVGFAQGATVGAKEGYKDDVSWIKKADTWVKENLW